MGRTMGLKRQETYSLFNRLVDAAGHFSFLHSRIGTLLKSFRCSVTVHIVRLCELKRGTYRFLVARVYGKMKICIEVS